MKDQNKELVIYGRLLDIFNLYIMDDYLNFLATMVTNTKNYQGSTVMCFNHPWCKHYQKEPRGQDY
jgi:hypothetical protein